MATLSNQESRRLYSWWWDSHISPKNSKWLQENLTDMDAKVKAMIRLIEEDADSFARRAEMYYKKRPELMKLVEEFYRAYRALSERYDHATVELRQAHRTMAEAFPNQYVIHDDQPAGSSGPGAEPLTPEMPHPIHALIDPDDLQKDSLGLSSTNIHALRKNDGDSEDSDSGISKRGLKQLNEIFGSGERKQSLEDRFSHFSTENQNLKTQFPSNSQHGGKAESEVDALKKTLAEIQAEKEAVLLQYQKSFQKFSSLEKELKHVQKDAGGLDEQASKADIEIKVLKEALVKLESERDAGLLQYNSCLERLSTLETTISQAQDDAKGLNERASKAEIEAHNLKQELSRLEAEKEAGLLQYRQCLEMIFALEKKISFAEEHSKMLNEQTERAETEVKTLKQALARLNEEKEAAAFQYEWCMDKIAKLESEIFHAQEYAKRLVSEVLMGAAKLKTAEQQCVLLERSNQSLQVEADSLAQKILIKDQELSEKQEELEKVQDLMQDEHSQFVQVEAALQTLQKLHSQSQEEQKALTLELQNKLQTLKDLEICNHCLEEDIRQVRKENQDQRELNHSSAISTKNLQNEILNLKEMKEKLEEEIALQVDKSTALQQEVLHLKEEMMDLNRRYQALVEQVLSVSLKPESLESSVKLLQDENLKLKEACKKHTGEREFLCEKLRNMDNLSEKNAMLQSSLSELNGKLGGSREKVKGLQESCQFLQEEKSSLVAEKATLLSQLHIMTENMQKLLEKNFLLEKSLAGANVELEGLRAKSKSLEEFSRLLKNEKSNLQNERGTLVSKLEIVERKIGNLENRFTKLEEKYADLEKGKESTLFQVEELRGSLSTEQQERASYVHSSESRMADLENHVHLLQEESELKKKEFEEELDKAVNAQVEIFILQKFLKDLEEKNLFLTIECQKHVEASKLSNKFISELETENLEQQVETEFLLDEIEKLRVGIYQVFRAVRLDPVNWHEDKMEQGQIPIRHILENVEDLKSSLLRKEDEKQQLMVENLVLSTSLGQLKLEGAEFESEKKMVEHEFVILTEQHEMLQKEKGELMVENSVLLTSLGQLKLEGAEFESEKKMVEHEFVILTEQHEMLQKEKGELMVENSVLLTSLGQLKLEGAEFESEKKMVEHEFVILTEQLEMLQNENGELMVENSVLLTSLGQLKLEGAEFESEKKMVEHEFVILTEQHEMLQKEKGELVEMNRQLTLEVSEGRRRQDALKSDLDSQGVKLVNLQEAYLALQEENSKMLGENGLLLKKFLALKEEMCALEEENKVLFQEAVDLDSLSWVFKSFGIEKAEEVKALAEDLNGLRIINGDLKEKVELLGEKLGGKEAEGWHLNETVEKLYKELHDVRDLNVQLNNQILTGQDALTQNAMELLEAEQKLKATHNLNGELWRTIEDLKKECEELTLVKEIVEKRVSEMSEDFTKQNTEIERLHEVKRHLKTEVGMLRKEIEEGRIREVYLSFELQERNNEFELWDADAASFYFDLQISSIREVLLENKVHELTGVCESLEDEKASKSVEIDRMKEKVAVLEGEIGELKAQLSSYVPAPMENMKLKNPPPELQVEKELEVDKLELSISNREPNKEGNKKKILERLDSDGQKLAAQLSSYVPAPMENMKLKNPPPELQVEKELEVDKLELSISNTEPNKEGNKKKILERLDSDAQNLTAQLSLYVPAPMENMKLKNPPPELQVEKELEVDKLELSISNREPNKEGNKKKILERLDSDAQKLTAQLSSYVPAPMENMKLKNPPPELQVEKELEVDKLELSISNREPNKEGNKKKILERLDSDAQKLTSLQTSVQDLKKKLETSKRSKKTNDPEYERVKGQLRELDEAVVQLADSNLKLTKDTEEVEEEAGDVSRNKVTEEAQKGSEKIGSLQLEIQSIQYVVLKLEDEDNTTKGKFMFSKSKTGVLLRNFINSGGGSSSSSSGGGGGGRRKKGYLCECMRPST